jgi:5-methylcytosine-specific restriction endonuclease McrA
LVRRKRRSSSVGDFILGKSVKNPFEIKPSKNPFEMTVEPKRDSRRAFNATQRKEILFQQEGKCARCHKKLDPRAIQFDHKKPWASGGRTIKANGRALCSECHDIISHEERLKK